MLCNKCGTQNIDSNKNCINCGNVLDEKNVNEVKNNYIEVLSIDDTKSSNSIIQNENNFNETNNFNYKNDLNGFNNQNTINTDNIGIQNKNVDVQTVIHKENISHNNAVKIENDSIYTTANISNDSIKSENLGLNNNTADQCITNENGLNIGKNDLIINNSHFKNILKNKKTIIVLAIILLLVILTIIFIIINVNNKNDNFNNNLSSNSFFIENKDGIYAMFDIDGNQITDFEFESTSNFINHAAVVLKNNKYGLISDSGKIIVNYEEYEMIDDNGSVFFARKKDGSEVLINSKGKVIYKLNDKIDVISYLTEEGFTIIYDMSKNKYTILNNKGKEIKKITSSNDEVKLLDPYSDNGYKSIYIDGKTYVLDENKGEIFLTFNGKYYFEYITDDKTKQIFINQDDSKEVLIENGKIIDDNQCDSYHFSGNQVICSKGESHYLYINKKLYLNVYENAYKDYKNYVTYDSYANQSLFYNEGQLVKSDKCLYLDDKRYNAYGLFILKNKCIAGNEKYAFYNSKGENVFNKYYKEIHSYDDNGHAVVSEDGINKYLIDTNGNKVSKEYDSIQKESEYYLVKKNDLYGLLDKELNEVISVENYKVGISFNKCCTLTKEDGSTVIYDLKNKKELFNFKEKVSITYHDEYMEVDDNVTNKYYSYTTGKMFYDGK